VRWLKPSVVWFVDPTFLDSKSKVAYFWNCIKLSTLVWNYSVCSQSSWPIPKTTTPKVLCKSMASWQNECNKVNIGQYVKTIMTYQRIPYCAWLILLSFANSDRHPSTHLTAWNGIYPYNAVEIDSLQAYFKYFL